MLWFQNWCLYFIDLNNQYIFIAFFSAHVFVWQGTEVVFVNNSTDIIKTKTGKNCIQQVDGVTVHPSKCSKYPNKTLRWYKKIHTQKVFSGARNYCDNENWRLFGEYNGTKVQIDWLLEGTGFPAIYLGIERKESKTQWVTVKGVSKTTLIKKKLTGGDNISKKRRIVLKKNYEVISAKGRVNKRNFLCVIVDWNSCGVFSGFSWEVSFFINRSIVDLKTIWFIFFLL